MIELRTSYIAATRVFLLAHVDPLFLIEVAERSLRYPSDAARPNRLVFGSHIAPRLHSLIRLFVGHALDERFIGDLCDIVEHSHLGVDLEGLRVLRQLDSALQVTEAPEPHDESFAGVVAGADAACDLLLQPLMAFSNLFNSLADQWIKIADNPDLSGRVFYRTNLSSYFETRLESCIRLELGFSGAFLGQLVNLP